MKPGIHGLLAEFSAPASLLRAVRAARAAGFTRIETFAPCPVDGLAEELLPRPSPLPGVMLAAGALGAAGGFGLQVWAASDYPVDVGGRPVFSWPAFVPVTFELGVLTAVLAGVVALLWRIGLPRYHHPVFAAAAFARASTDRFFLCLRADDPRYSAAAARDFFAALGPESLVEVPS
ncbi:MAG TPA: DUF3341 domain-containing protein [Opitutaceae bacterium]|nr:DUF3341 domain-containing protein [Opitutaceae bacterium]